MKLKELQAVLQDVQTFRIPKVELEQYPTYPHIAARMLYTIQSVYNEIEGSRVVDLGCGTGMLSIGAALLGSAHVIAVDIDESALAIAQENITRISDDLPVDFVLCDVRHLTSQSHLRVPVVITNPPFGTKRKGADLEFLSVACKIATQSVYSLHKSSTRAHIKKTAEREFGVVSSEVLAELKYDLPATMKFHKEKSLDIDVDLWRFEIQGVDDE